MGYDLHITRREHWSDEGDVIRADEWLAYVQQDSELHLQPENGPYFAEWRRASVEGWLDWFNGDIFSKNPDTALIDKMVVIARQLNAAVQGDDGEIYDGDSTSASRPTLSFGERVTNWFKRFRPRRHSEIEAAPLPFGVGDKVRDP